MKNVVLAINAGSSTIKFGAFETGDGAPELVLRGLADDHAPQHALTLASGDGSAEETVTLEGERTRENLFRVMLDEVDRRLAGRRLLGVGHRVVHGGPAFSEPVIIDADTFAAIEELTPLAPLHQPRCLEPIRALLALRTDLPQVACFDTAFHRTLSPTAARYAIPRTFEEKGVRKYGFHGLSYESIAHRLHDMSPELSAGRTVVAHLGNGASMCAMRDGRSLDTTMGLSVLDGLVMGTRCGSIDPGVVLYLQKACGFDADGVEDLLYHRSGLLGVSGSSSDMRELLANSDQPSRDAAELFVHRAAQATATMAHALEGRDTLVFTGGIGEHSPQIRAAIGDRLGWLGVRFDAAANERASAEIGGAGSRVRVLILPAEEERMIALHTNATLRTV